MYVCVCNNAWVFRVSKSWCMHNKNIKLAFYTIKGSMKGQFDWFLELIIINSDLLFRESSIYVISSF